LIRFPGSGCLKKESMLLSVIIPTYNRASFLKEAIQSVLDQDYFNNKNMEETFELLVIDDGSTDRTRDIVESFPPPVSYYFQENRGVSAARNFGLEISQGEFVAFLDSDDLWKRDKISSQMSLMKTLIRISVCYTEEIWIRRGNFVNPKIKHKKYSGWIFDKVLPLCLLSLSSALFRKTVFAEVGGFDEDFPVCEDYDLGLRVAHRYPVHLITKPLIVKRGGHPDQLSHKYWGMDEFRVKALEKVLGLDLSPREEKLVKQEIVSKCRILALGFEKRGKTSEALHYSQKITKFRINKEEI
jgi:glycosyltransferase involved in cell wall biosynthesis